MQLNNLILQERYKWNEQNKKYRYLNLFNSSSTKFFKSTHFPSFVGTIEVRHATTFRKQHKIQASACSPIRTSKRLGACGGKCIRDCGKQVASKATPKVGTNMSWKRIRSWVEYWCKYRGLPLQSLCRRSKTSQMKQKIRVVVGEWETSMREREKV